MATANAQLGDPAFDSKRKRRELTNLLSVGFGKAYRPHQHVGLDEATREHKHWGKMRIRFKAAVHSGALVDSLNDCQTKYCLAFEEQHWLRKKDGEEDPNTIKERLLRLTSVLHDQDKDHSSANFCLSLDRGYGHIEAQRALMAKGIYSNAMLQANRIGLPRKLIEAGQG